MSLFNCSYLSKFLLDFCQIFTIISVFESSFCEYFNKILKIAKKKMFSDVITWVLYIDSKDECSIYLPPLEFQ